MYIKNRIYVPTAYPREAIHMSNEELSKELNNLINKISDNMALVLILRFVKGKL